MNRLILIGPRLAGKTTLGRHLADAWSLPFTDLDDQVANVTGRSPDDWLNGGEETTFRHWENHLLNQWLEEGQGILATGGGAPLHPDAVDALQAFHPVVYLKGDPSVLWQRQQTSSRAPLTGLSGPDELKHLIWQRDGIYASLSDVTLDASLPPDELALALSSLRRR